MITGVELPSLAGLVSAIKFMFDHTAIPAEKRKQWFEDHIEPSYKQLCEVHDDYSKQFSNALSLLTRNTELEDVVEVLKSDRPNLLLKRQEVRESLLALRDYRMERKRKPKVVIVFYDYVSSVDEYLNAASPLPRATWYSYFIDTFSELVREGKDPLSYEYPACSEGRRAPDIAIEQLRVAVQSNMPQAMRKVQTNYARLRTECLAQI